MRRDRKKDAGRGGGVPKSSKYNSNKTVFKSVSMREPGRR